MRHREDSAPALDAGSSAAQGKQLGHLQREHVACPFLGCEVHLVKVSTLGGIMSGRWMTSFCSSKRCWSPSGSPATTPIIGAPTPGIWTPRCIAQANEIHRKSSASI